MALTGTAHTTTLMGWSECLQLSLAGVATMVALDIWETLIHGSAEHYLSEGFLLYPNPIITLDMAPTEDSLQ